MLLPHEFSLDYIGNATGLTLVLPVASNDRACLVTLATGKPSAIIIDEREEFFSFMCENNAHWKGMLIPNVAIELDEITNFDAAEWSPPLGTLVRQRDSLCISAKHEDNFPAKILVPIITGLPANHANMKVGFKKWQIVIGEGLSKRVLMAPDTNRQNKSER
jgi:hypothetical protein